MVESRELGLLRFRAETDRFDFHAGELAAMTDRAVITFAAAKLKRDDLFILLLLDHFSVHGRARDERAAMGDAVAVTNEEDIGEHAFLADLRIEEINLYDVAFGDAVLSTA